MYTSRLCRHPLGPGQIELITTVTHLWRMCAPYPQMPRCPTMQRM